LYRWREWCGLPEVRTWDDLVGVMSNRTIFAYRKVYESPADIDIWSAGISEHSLPGKYLGKFQPQYLRAHVQDLVLKVHLHEI
jgi:hypothetical protein